jgi:hypothetical protein
LASANVIRRFKHGAILLLTGDFSPSDALAERKRDAMPETGKRKRQTLGRSSIDQRVRPLALRNFGKRILAGTVPIHASQRKRNALVESGLDPQMLIDEVRKFASTEAGRGNIGTRFIPQAVTWLN